MRLVDMLKIGSEIRAAAAGTQATAADPRSADEWIKKWLDEKNERQNELRRKLNYLMGPEKGEWHAAYRMDKRSPFPQRLGLAPGSTTDKWLVVTPENEIISRWPTKEDATLAAWGMWKGIKSAGGATEGAKVMHVDQLEAADIFEDPTYGDRTRARFLKHPKPRVVQDADIIRTADNRPSSNGPGSASYEKRRRRL